MFTNNDGLFTASTNGDAIGSPTEEYLNEKYDFRFNIITGKVEFKKKAETTFSEMRDYDDNSLYRELQRNHIKCSLHNLRMLLRSDFVEKHDPFTNYLDSLAKWDEKTDYIDMLASQVKTTNDEYWKKCFKKWFVAMVGSLLKENTVNHQVIVFSGRQGIGKTTWLENLVPNELKKYLFSGNINPDNKDTLSQLSECIIIHLDEMDSLAATHAAKLKEIITKTNIRFRKAYGYNNENYIRRASFVASINSEQFLDDATGSRRFLCFKVVDINYKEQAPLDKAYAQARFLFEQGFKYWFEDGEVEEITTNNEMFQIKTLEEELLNKYFVKTESTLAQLFLTTTEIAVELSSTTKFSITDSSIKKLGKALYKSKFIRLKKKDRYGWLLNRRKATESVIG